MKKVLILVVFALFQNGYSKDVTMKSKYASISIDENGYIANIKDLSRNANSSDIDHPIPIYIDH